MTELFQPLHTVVMQLRPPATRSRMLANTCPECLRIRAGRLVRPLLPGKTSLHWDRPGLRAPLHPVPWHLLFS